jgi:hypothetical protein
MGKNSLLKSTGKKKKGSSVKPEPENPPAGTENPATESTPPATPASILFRKFGEWKPENPFRPPPQIAPPPAAAPASEPAPGEEERFRELRFRKFDPATLPPLPGDVLEDEIEAVVARANPVEEPAQTPQAVQTVTEEPVTEEPSRGIKTDQPHGGAGSIDPPRDRKGSEPMDKTMKFLLAGFALLLLLVIGASYANRSSYYVIPRESWVEIRRGIFAPMGSEIIVTLPGAQQPTRVKEKYTREEAYALAFGHYINRSDAMLNVPGIPDFESIRSTLNRALAFAITDTHRNTVRGRLNTIELMTLLYRADVAASRGTSNDLEASLGYLREASALRLDETQAMLVRQKIEVIKNMQAALTAKPGTRPPAQPVQPPKPAPPAPPAKPAQPAAPPAPRQPQS